MIRFLTGTVKQRGQQFITLDVQGIGFAVWVPDEHEFSKEQQVTLSIYFAWNQEQGPQLYGFTSTAAHEIFCAVLNCPGIGPKMGLALLSKLSPQEFVTAILTANTKVLSSVSGVGAKKAEVIIMHLKDKIAKLEQVHTLVQDNTQFALVKDLNQTLLSLGYTRSEVTAALEYIKQYRTEQTTQTGQDTRGDSLEELLRKALIFLAKRT